MLGSIVVLRLATDNKKVKYKEILHILLINLVSFKTIIINSFSSLRFWIFLKHFKESVVKSLLLTYFSLWFEIEFEFKNHHHVMDQYGEYIVFIVDQKSVTDL